jgi:CBS domain-containing protein
MVDPPVQALYAVATMITIRQLLEGKSRELFFTTATEPVSAALAVLAQKKIGALLVMDGERLVGILSERDCALKVALPGKRAEDVRVGDIMTSSVITVDPTRTLEECIQQMNDRDIRHLPVLEEGKVTGMVSIGDVSKEMLKYQFQLIGQLESYIRGGYR